MQVLSFLGYLLVLINQPLTQVCASRLRTRRLIQWPLVFHSDEFLTRLGTEHPTIKNPEDALSILDRFSSQYRAPSADEGYNRILYLQPSEQEVVYSHSSLATILHRIRDAPSVASVGPAVSQHSTWGSPYSRGGYFRGARSRGRGGHNVNHTGGASANNAPPRNMNKWAVFSEQRESQAQRPKDTESVYVLEAPVVADSNSSEPKAADGAGAGLSSV